MKRTVQLYIQQDKIDNEFCFCLKVFIGEDGENGYFITAQTNSQDDDGFNIYTFTYNETTYEIRKGTINVDLDGDAWYVFIAGDYGGYYAYSLSDNSNLNSNCPARNNWLSETWSRVFYTQSCTINRDYYERLELFEDEKIVLNSSKQNIDDLKSVFSDFTQSFVVPASQHNNAILEHWYNSEVLALQDNRLRRKSRIEIDLTPFRDGKIQIEKANIKDGVIYSYTLTFFADLVTLKDKIGEAKLNVLPLSGYAYFNYDLNTIADFIEYDFDQDVVFPLISSKRLWTLGDGGVDDLRDDTTTGDGLYFTELFPAFRVKKILNEIENYFDITFTGSFIDYTNPRFMNLYLWLKNQEIKKDNLGNATILPSTRESVLITDTVEFGGVTVFYQPTNTAILNWVQSSPNGVRMRFIIDSVTSPDEYIIDIFMNGNLLTSITTSGTGFKFIKEYRADNGTYGNWIYEYYEFFIRSKTANTINTRIDIQYLPIEEYIPNNYCTVVLSGAELDLDSFIPDIKIIDFLKGIFNQFNLTCYQTAENTYNIITLEEWYRTGLIHDITEYTDITSIDINRISLPKATRFNYQKSESFVNRIFAANNGREYGMTGINWTFDGGEYVIDLPFEQLKFLSQPNNLIPLGYSLKSDVIPPASTTDLKEYIPKPILLYKYGLSNIDVAGNRCRMTDGTNTRNFSQVLVFGQDTIYGTADISLNFSTDESEFLKSGEMLYNAYSMYYQSYISNLYAINQRMITIKTNIPLSLLTTLKLNDRLIIKDKRYIINDYQADLTSGDVSFNLILDFRDLTTYGWAEDAETFPPDEIE